MSTIILSNEEQNKTEILSNVEKTHIELLINKSSFFQNLNEDNNELSDKDLFEIKSIIEAETKLKLKDIFDLIINENIELLFNNFSLFSFIIKYDFDNYDSLKKKYDDFKNNKINEIQNKADIEKNEIQKKSRR